MRNCFKYPTRYRREGIVRMSDTVLPIYGVKTNKGAYKSDQELDILCLSLSVNPRNMGVLIDDYGTFQGLVYVYKQTSASFHALDTTTYNYYDIIPEDTVLWHDSFFDYTRYDTLQREHSGCIKTVGDEAKDVCAALPTCLGYFAGNGCLIGTGNTYNPFIPIMGGVGPYMEKRMQHKIIWIVEDAPIYYLGWGIGIMIFIEIVMYCLSVRVRRKQKRTSPSAPVIVDKRNN